MVVVLLGSASPEWLILVIGVKSSQPETTSALVLAMLFLVSTALFLSGRFSAALLVSVMDSQLWRALAETVRADLAGRGCFTAYQSFVFATAALCAIAVGLLPAAPAAADPAAGLASRWSPVQLLTLELLPLAVFFAMGRGIQACSSLEFGVHAGHP